METKARLARTIDEYLSFFDDETAARLAIIREIAHKEIPEGVEAIKYTMPTIVYKGNLICFAGYKKHVAIYPVTPEMLTELPELTQYMHGKATLKFPHNIPLPVALISKAIALRLSQHV